MPSNTIAIIGFGATGLSCFIQIIKQAIAAQGMPIKFIYILFPRKEFVGGHAFTTANDEHILNTPAYLMSCYSHQPNHFVEWLNTHGILTLHPERSRFREYLFEQWLEAKKSAEKLGITIIEVPQEAHAIHLDSNGRYQLIFVDKKTIIVDKIVYTPGRPPQHFDAEYLNSCGHFLFASHQSLADRLPTNSEGGVAILGMGLSAIDAILTLKEQTHIRYLDVYSRSGLLPSSNGQNPRDMSQFLRPIYFTESQLKQLLHNNQFSFKKILWLLGRELARYPIHELSQSRDHLRTRDYTNYYRTLLPLAQRNFIPLVWLLSSTRPYFSNLWLIASTAQKNEFQRFFRYWAIFRHPLPYLNTIKILKLLEAKRLRIHTYKTIKINPSTTLITSTQGIKHYHAVIHAQAYDFDFNHSCSPFDQSLLQEKLVKPHPFGGIYVCPNTLQVRPGFYAAGEIIRGMFYSTNAFWFNVRLSERLARHLFNKQPIPTVA